MSGRGRLVVVWRVTEACNLTCGFCRYARDLPTPRAEADPAQVEAVVRALAVVHLPERRVLVSFLGGEPLLWKPLFPLARTLRNQVGVELSVTTNGTRLGAAVVREALLADFAEVTISVDGLDGVHDALRGVAGGYAGLASAIAALAREKRVRGHGPLIRVNSVLMRDNIGAFYALARALCELGVEELSFNQLGGLDRPEFFAEHWLLPAQVAELAARFEEERTALALRGLRLLGSPRYLSRLAASATGRRLPVASCAPGEDFLFVDERGVLAPCSFTTVEYGATLDAAVLPARLPALFAQRSRARRAASCEDCASTRVFGKFADGT